MPADPVRVIEYRQGQFRSGPAPDAAWWRDPNPGLALVCHSDSMWNDAEQAARRQQHLRYARLWANQRLSSLYEHGTAKGMTDDAYLCWNLIKINVETAESKIGKNKARVVVEPMGGNWSLGRSARKASKFLYGEFQRSKFYQAQERVFLDGAVFGTGIGKACIRGGKIEAQRVLPDEVQIDTIEGLHGDPRSAIHRQWYHKDVAVAEFAESTKEKGAIWDAPEVTEADPGIPTGIKPRDLVVVREGWRLPTMDWKGKVYEQGMHVIAVPGVTLLKEEFEKERLPFWVFRWGHRMAGWWGQGIAEALIGLQIRINDLNERIEAIERLMSKPVTWVKNKAKLNYEDLTDDLGLIVECDEEPTFRVYNAVPDQLYAERDRCWQKSFELAGNSEMSAAGVKPAGLNSAPSLREWHDIESGRLISPSQRFEQTHVEAAEVFFELGKDLHHDLEDRYVVATKAPGARFLEEIKWSEFAGLKRNQFDLGVFPVSMLPTTPAGKRQALEEWWKMGLIDKAMFMSLAEMPDLEAASGLLNAGMEDIRATIERILDDGVYDPPERYQDLQLGLRLVQSAYLKAKRDDAPLKRLDMLARWLFEADHVLKNGQAPPAAPPVASGPPPEMAGALPPISSGNPALPSEVPVLPPAAAPAPM